MLGRADRWASIGQRGATVWFTGLSGSGKSTVASLVEAALLRRARIGYLLDGDNLRHGLNADLGFSDADRTENVRRVAAVAQLFADAGCVALVSLVSPFRADRDAARAAHTGAGLPFFEVHMAATLEECRRRDPKGLYARVDGGGVPQMTGITSPYEPPLHPDLVLDATTTAQAGCEMVVALLEQPVPPGAAATLL